MAARAKEVPLLKVMLKQGSPITSTGIKNTLKDILSNIAKTRQAIWTNELDQWSSRSSVRKLPVSTLDSRRRCEENSQRLRHSRGQNGRRRWASA